MKLSEKLRTLCDARGWDQSDLARAIKRETGESISKASINAWFNGEGNPSLKSGRLVALTLGVSLDYLADDSLALPPAPAAEPNSEDAYILRTVRASGLSYEAVVRALIAAGVSAAIAEGRRA